ncbi:MAG: hypothetical protein JRN58_06595 [Nitrososphaerota archaeon]|nr:hypothetical protein [Nitrososphaerota archaeon]MDG6966927.1 hypothetical protein [Nitrososphaerota archaeon]MDG6978731.1 hypothetical protein [Nitrososphaerota archaeon]
MKIGRLSTVVLALVFLVSLSGLLLPFDPFGMAALADLFGFLALALIAGTGVLMLFKARLARSMGSPERLWRLHILVAGAGGVFLGLHVVLFLAFPISLPVLLGYAATGAALFVWTTGAMYFQAVRNSAFYHGLLSIGAVLLIVLHTVGSGTNIPSGVSGIGLALSAALVLLAVALRVSRELRGGQGPGRSHS